MEEGSGADETFCPEKPDSCLDSLFSNYRVLQPFDLRTFALRKGDRKRVAFRMRTEGCGYDQWVLATEGHRHHPNNGDEPMF